MSQARHSSSHDLSASHDGAGLASLFSSPTPPVRKNMNSSLSMLCLALQEGRKEDIVMEGRKEDIVMEGRKEDMVMEGRDRVLT